MSTDSQESTPQLLAQPSGMLRVTRTELIWPGKYNEDGTRKEVPRVSLPFQVIETMNESQATREARKKAQPTLFDFYEGKEGDTFETGWKNKLIWGDNLLVMGSLLEKFAGKIDLIYIDPPFATGADFSFAATLGDDKIQVEKEQSVIEEKAYRDTWGRGVESYLAMLHNRLMLMHDLLSPSGAIYVHVGHTVSHYVRALMDEIFGYDKMLNEIIWQRTGAHNDALRFGVVSDVILFYAMGEKWTWNQQYTDYEPDYVEERYRYEEEATGRKFYPNQITGQGSGPPRRFGGRTIPPPPGRHWAYTQEDIDRLMGENRIYFSSTGYPYIKNYLDEQKGRPVQNVWTDLPMTKSGSERSDYPTQKPERLLDRIIRTSSNARDLVADLFSGSGTTMAVAEKLGRRWIGCDLSRWAIHISRKRFLDIEGCKPFDVLNLGKYERQYWQGVTFGSKGRPVTEQALYEYLAFILRLYGAQPVAGLAHLHGKKGRSMVHIGAVDAPVTIDEINLALDECAKLKQPELHVLGWEWEMGLYDLMIAEAKKKGVKLLLLQIPREVMEQQAVDKGDIQFFELAYLEVEVKTPKKLTATVTLKDFVIPNTELIPEDVRSKVKKWSDYVDYWAVDWNFQNDTFLQGWVTYRTRKDRTLALTSDPHVYEKAGKYRILVKVIDIFGNDTSQAFDVEVR